VTTYLLEIMVLGAALFVFASLWEKHEAERPNSIDQLAYSAGLEPIEREILTLLQVNVKRRKSEPAGDAQAEDAPRKATAK